ncbi:MULTISPECIES: 23S rRNA pseudouridine(955/2504/2580) synthase RluC [Ferrimonas]|uniref:23S rRNA pseudouridine(955/2504/2580) synthase RluC n=1 Tax=Ferrimonas TaxID=44011 RepID=UPI0004857249|nr:MULTISPECIES: 23S rRNA pseudouridine(955/2504/2580) synthase RluC [Ferrimonas]USD36358.1 23S rRNA pseudouridine(955/2504/2580) synthase RluC [Ferrimonas sp. SCSIO 43195]
MTDSKTPKTPKVQWVTVEPDYEGQRIDNFLRTFLKGVPKSLIYRLLRKGEIRVNKKRIKPEYKLIGGDEIRIAPIRVSEKSNEDTAPSAKLRKVAELEQHIVYEDKLILVINKPSGIAVHGGSGVNFGVIEALRALRPEEKNLELVHRLDRATSGLLMLAKRRSALKHMQNQLRSKTMKKQYLALVKGKWQDRDKVVNEPLLKNTLKSGERLVRVDGEGKPSETRFRVVERFGSEATLVEASPITGRTHQIRVHAQCKGHPIACDDRYGDDGFDRNMKERGLDRLFLHAHKLRFIHPGEETTIELEAPMEPRLKRALKALNSK